MPDVRRLGLVRIGDGPTLGSPDFPMETASPFEAGGPLLRQWLKAVVLGGDPKSRCFRQRRAEAHLDRDLVLFHVTGYEGVNPP